MKEEKKIVVAGTMYLDIKGYPAGEFYPTCRNSGKIEYRYGGVGRNVACDLAGLGYSPVFLSLTDESAYGKAMYEDLKEKGVVADHVVCSNGKIGTWMAIFNTEGEVFANLSERQDMTELKDVVSERADEVFKDCAGVLIEIDIEEAVVEEVFRQADHYNVPVYGVISNMAIARERLDYIKKCRCFICNRMEAAVLFEEDAFGIDREEMLKLLKDKMQELDISCMVVTMDSEGAVFADMNDHNKDGETIFGICQAEKVEVVDSTGAGDAFFAGTVSAMIDGMPLDEACKKGAEAAACVLKSFENIYPG